MANASTALMLHAVGAELGAGTSAALDIGDGRSAAFVSLRSFAGGALQLTIETSPDGVTGWRKAGELIRSGAVSALTRIPIDGLERWLRATWPSSTDATFTLTAVAHQLYATREDLFAKLSREHCKRADEKEPGAVARALIEASCAVEDKLDATYGLPLASVSESLVGATASIAAFTVLQRNGFAGGGVDELATQAKADAIKWLDGVVKAHSSLAGTSSAVGKSGAARIRSAENRGW